MFFENLISRPFKKEKSFFKFWLVGHMHIKKEFVCGTSMCGFSGMTSAGANSLLT